MANPENKQIPYESTQQDIRDAIESVATAIGGIAVPSADHVSYDNSGSGLSATDVQNALDEIVSDIPTVNNGTLTIQQNGTSKGSFTANSASNVNVNIETPTADKKTATDQFTTADGGLLSKCMIDLVPVQSGSGDPSPDNVRPISGHTEVDLHNVGKNKLDISGFSTTINSGVTLTPNGDGTVKVTGTATATSAVAVGTVSTNGSYILNGCPSGGTTNSYRIDIRRNGTVVDSDYGDGTNALELQAGDTVNVRFANGYAFPSGGLIFKPMIRLASESDSTFEPYLGHLYQVQIGSTVYGGYVDLVSGVMIATHSIVTYDGSENWYWASGDPNAWFFANRTDMVNGREKDLISNRFKQGYWDDENSLWRAYQQIHVKPDSNVAPSGQSATGLSEFKTWLGSNNLQVVYPLATPIAIQLTPQQIEALVGQNNLSTPLDGQSIETNGVEYKELFTFADVVNRVDVKAGTGEESVVMNHINGSYTNTASGRWSTATGYNSTSSGDFSYTEGYGCIASALYTHAEGVGNQATSRASHAEGDTNKAIANSAHAEGYDTIAGYYNESTQTYTGTSSHAEGISTRTYGNGSHAEGWQSRAEAIYSHAEGEITVASAEAAHTEGIQTTASGYAAHAEGASSQATGNYSHVEGSYGVASGNCSHAGGLRSEASSNQSFAHGNTVTASNKFSAAFGISNYEKLSSGDNDNTYTLFSVGNGTIVQSGTTYVKDTPSNAFEVRKNGTVIEGSGCGANGNAAHAEGNGTHANGNCSHAEGNIGTASGYAAHVEGNGCTASGDDAHAEGAWTIASGVVSHVGGDASQSRGYASYAMGKEAIAGGNESFASGYKVNAAAARSFTHGYFTLVSNPDEVAFGVANSEVLSTTDPTAYTVFAIGNGTVENEVATARSNVFEVRSNGDVLANNSKLISVSELQTIVASCTDFSDFKTAIAAL